MFTTALIDIDGVINHAERFSNRYSAQYKVPIEKLLPFFEAPFQECLAGERDIKEVLPQYFKEWSWQGNIDELLDFWFTGEVDPDEEVVKIIKSLHDRGVSCVGASNQEKYRMDYLRQALHLNEYMNAVFSSAEIGYLKPEPEFYNSILSELKLKPEHVVFWDDDIENIVSARNLGIKSYRFIDKRLFARQVNECFPQI